MSLPADIARIRHSWARREGDAWTSEAFRSPIIVWLDTFLSTHAWASTISIVEKFHAPDANRKKPFGSTHRARDPRTIEEGFRQSTAMPVLNITAVRAADLEEFEVSLHFAEGALTDLMSLDFYLGQARAAIESEEARRALA